MSFVCEFCSNVYNTKYHLTRHHNSESCKKIQNIINKNNNKNNEKIKLLELEISKITQENIILKNDIKSLEKSNESFRKIVEKAATKTTIKNNYSHNNYLNYISSEPIKISEFPKQLKNIVNCETVMYDDTYFHDHIVDNILKDKNGKDKILCTDINRKNFTYKDEKSGQLVSDPELERLREQLIKGSNSKSIKKDLLDNLIKKYEGTGIDPYNKFYEYIQNIQFGTPFVEHVAKKTYIKTKPEYKEINSLIDNNSTIIVGENINDINSCNEEKNYKINNIQSYESIDDININNININNINIESIDDFEYSGKLYNKMKEF